MDDIALISDCDHNPAISNPNSCGCASSLPLLCSVPDVADCDAFTPHLISHKIGSATDYQLSNSRSGANSAQPGMHPQGLDKCDDSGGDSVSCLGIISCNISANFRQSSSGQRGPDYFYRQSASSSCSLPQTHLGGGSSWSVPQERSQAFISSCRM